MTGRRNAAFRDGSAIAIMAFLAAAPALAQQADGGEARRDDDIVVTAQFREQSVQDTPLAITAVTGETLAARGQTNITDLGSFAPNVNLSQAAAIQGNAVAAFIRGIGQEDANFALEPGVGIYIDDVYLGTTFGSSLDLVDLERAEILRGPQGTLAGKNSLGGAIKLYTRKPGDDFEGFAEASYGRFDALGLKGSLNIPIVEGVATRFSGSYRRDDGYFEERDFGCANPGQGIAATGEADKNCVLDRAGGRDILTLRGALRVATPGSPLEINIAGDYTRDRSQPVASMPIYANFPLARSYAAGNPFAGVPFDSRFLPPAGSYYNYENYSEAGNYTTVFCDPTFGCAPTQVTAGTFPDKRQNSVDGWGISGTVDLHLSDDLTLKSISAYREADGTTVLAIDGSPINILKERLRNRHRQFTQELRLSGRIGDSADFTVGGFYYDALGRMNFRIMIPTLLYDFQTADRVESRSYAGFAHVEWHLTDKLNLIGGLRYTNDRKIYRFSRRNADGSVISGVPLTWNFLVASLDGLTGTFKGDRVDYRIGANYAFTDDVMAYAQVSTGYKGGGVNPRPFVADQVTPFDPETLLTVEGGVKSTLMDGAATLNAAVFYNDYKGIQRTVYVCPESASTACGMPVNAGDGHSYGAEFETTIKPGGGWLLAGSLSLLDFKYDSINPATGVTLDMRAPFHSKVTASASVQYAADLGNNGTLTPRVDFSYQSSFYYQAINNPAYNLIDGRALVNARLTYDSPDKAWQLSAGVANLFNKYYLIGASENIANFGLSSVIVGPPRTWSVSARFNF